MKLLPGSVATFFQDVLDSLAAALRYHHPEVQRGALSSMSQLAAMDESVRHGIVAGSLKRIVNLMINPRNARETRNAAEEVLRSVGFLGGQKDLECCGFDVALLIDWYSIKRSLKPQDAAHEILLDWVGLFFTGVADGGSAASTRGNSGVDKDTSSSNKKNGGHFVGGLLFHAHSERFFAGSKNNNGGNSLKEYTDLSEFSLHHQYKESVNRGHGASYDLSLKHEAENILLHVDSTNDDSDSGGSLSSDEELHSSRDVAVISKQQARRVRSRSSQNATSSPSIVTTVMEPSVGKLLSIPTLQRRFSDTLAYFSDRLLMPCKPVPALTGSVSVGSVGVSPSASSGYVHVMNRGGASSSSAAMGGGAGEQTPPQHQSGSGGVDSYDYLDVPPTTVTELYNLFYSSRLHQLLIMDLLSIGHKISRERIDALSGRNSIHDRDSLSSAAAFPYEKERNSGGVAAYVEDGDVDELRCDDDLSPEEDYYMLLPQPNQVSAILLPSRVYASFSRVGKVLERMFEYDDVAAASVIAARCMSPPLSMNTMKQQSVGSSGAPAGGINHSLHGSTIPMAMKFSPRNSNCVTSAVAPLHKTWSLSFVDSQFEGDFHTSLLTTLRR